MGPVWGGLTQEVRGPFKPRSWTAQLHNHDENNNHGKKALEDKETGTEG